MHGKRLEKLRPRFGHRLRTIRIRRGLTQEMLGQEIGVSHVQVSRWERLTQPPKFATVEKLAKGLNCGTTELLPFSGRDGNDSQITNLTKKISSQQEEIIQLVDGLKKLRMECECLRNERSSRVNRNEDVTKLLKVLYRTAAKSTHPDHGGQSEEFRKVKEAYEILMAMF